MENFLTRSARNPWAGLSPRAPQTRGQYCTVGVRKLPLSPLGEQLGTRPWTNKRSKLWLEIDTAVQESKNKLVGHTLSPSRPSKKNSHGLLPVCPSPPFGCTLYFFLITMHMASGLSATFACSMPPKAASSCRRERSRLS